MTAALLGSYRKGEAGDPEAYMTAVVAALVQYPQSVVDSVMALTGKFRLTHRWPPDAAEVAEACEAEMAPFRRQQEAERQAEERRRQREQDQQWASERPSLDALKAKYGSGWGLKPEVEDVEAKQKREAMRSTVNRFFHGDVDEFHASPLSAA